MKKALNGLIRHISNSYLFETLICPNLLFKMVNALSMSFKLLNMIWSDLHEEQIRPYQIRKKIKHNLCFTIYFGNKDILSPFYFRIIYFLLLYDQQDLLFTFYFRINKILFFFTLGSF